LLGHTLDLGRAPGRAAFVVGTYVRSRFRTRCGGFKVGTYLFAFIVGPKYDFSLKMAELLVIGIVVYL